MSRSRIRHKSTGSSDGTVMDTVYGNRNAVNTVDGAEPYSRYHAYRDYKPYSTCSK
jgi:hypothetical protein